MWRRLSSLALALAVIIGITSGGVAAKAETNKAGGGGDAKSYAVWRNGPDDTESALYYANHDYRSIIERVEYADITSDKIPSDAARLDASYSALILMQNIKFTDGQKTTYCIIGRMRIRQG